jgi:hypothetical protein
MAALWIVIGTLIVIWPNQIGSVLPLVPFRLGHERSTSEAYRNAGSIVQLSLSSEPAEAGKRIWFVMQKAKYAYICPLSHTPRLEFRQCKTYTESNQLSNWREHNSSDQFISDREKS